MLTNTNEFYPLWGGYETSGGFHTYTAATAEVTVKGGRYIIRPRFEGITGQGPGFPTRQFATFGDPLGPSFIAAAQQMAGFMRWNCRAANHALELSGEGARSFITLPPGTYAFTREATLVPLADALNAKAPVTWELVSVDEYFATQFNFIVYTGGVLDRLFLAPYWARWLVHTGGTSSAGVSGFEWRDGERVIGSLTLGGPYTHVPIPSQATGLFAPTNPSGTRTFAWLSELR